MKKIKNYGYIPDVIEPENWILGASSLPQIILRPDGQWLDYFPKTEDQKKLTETFNCTAFSTLNCVEILFEESFGAERNYSDRFTGISAGTKPPGNTAQAVAEAVRKFGVIKEELLPFNDAIDTTEKYFSPNPLTKDLLQEGKKWLLQYGFGHEWLRSLTTSANKIKLMKQALQFSPLVFPVYAWEKTGEFYTNIENQQNTHLTVCAGYKENEYWIIFDSYAPYIKHLDWNFPFGTVKRFSLTYLGIPDKVNDLVKNSSLIINSEIYSVPQKVGFLKSIIDLLKSYLKFL